MRRGRARRWQRQRGDDDEIDWSSIPLNSISSSMVSLHTTSPTAATNINMRGLDVVVDDDDERHGSRQRS